MSLLSRLFHHEPEPVCPLELEPVPEPAAIAIEEFQPTDVPLPPEYDEDLHQARGQVTEIQLRAGLLRAKRLKDGDDVLARRPRRPKGMR